MKHFPFITSASDPYPDEEPADDHNVDPEMIDEIDRLENEDEE